jgi:hypothetical protein
MDKDVLAAAVRLDETITLRRVNHLIVPLAMPLHLIGTIRIVKR